ncbi:hypothetical protein MAL08_01605 [Leptospira noguchii]|uniref:hypothetical protein n=1 Tax=Leptospira noguchii TaxID=28182 RepID=UPI001FB6795C|nr:hypothetical protein [Leptospira noguchii]UOG38092.1 hypothetical protein MAL08_01605 [Leptospira noguchii]
MERKEQLSVSLLWSFEVNSASHSPWVVRQVVSHFNYEICELRRRPGKLRNAYLWGGVQGVVALSLLFAPIFLRRTHVNINLSELRQILCKKDRPT